MKRFILTLMISLFGCGIANNAKPEGAFQYYEYRSTTMREYPREYYRLENTAEQGLTLTRSKSNSPYTVMRVSAAAAEQVRSLINEYKLYRLKDSYRPPFDVKDGIMWHVYFKFDKGSVSCSADNAWPPEALLSGIKAVNAYCNSLIEASGPEDIIEVRDNH